MGKKYSFLILLLLYCNHIFSQADAKAPELVSLNVQVDTINTKTSSATVTTKIIVKDDVSGNYLVGIAWRSPNGSVNKFYNYNYFNTSNLKDTAIITTTFPKNVDSGVWKIHFVTLQDNAGNSVFLYDNNVNFKSYGKDSVYIVSVPDAKAPELVSLNVQVDTINTKTSSATVTTKIIVKDDVSGNYLVGIAWRSPNGSVNKFYNYNYFNTSNLKDTAIITTTFPKNVDSGVWKIHFVTLQDNAGNSVFLYDNNVNFKSYGKDSVIVDYNAEIKNGAAFLIKDAYNIKSRSADLISTMSIIGNLSSYHDIRWQYQKGELIGANPEEQNLVTVDGAATLSNVNGGGNLINLTPGTKYSFRLVSKNKNGNIQTFSDLKQFTTTANSAPLAFDTTFSIKDSISTNGKVGKIRSLDADVDVLTFKIKSGNTNETFKLDSLGNVYVKNKINYDLINKYDLVVSVSDGFDSTTSKMTINVTPIPAFNYTGNFGVCTGDSLRVTTNKYLGYNILWYKNGALFNNTNTDTVYFKESANYQIKIVKGQDTLVSELKTLIVSTVPAAPIVNNTVICQTLTPIVLTATGVSGNTLLWYGNNATAGTSSTTVPKTNSTSTVVEYFYVSQRNNASSCESSRTKITINPVVPSPIIADSIFCQNVSNVVLSAIASTGNILLWYGNNATGGTGTSNTFNPNVSSTGITFYYVSQKSTTTLCESVRAKISVTVKPTPQAPIISRDTVGNLISTNTYGNSWYKDGAALNDTTQKFKPSTPGSYTAKTTQNGCASALSNPYYYLVTNVINLNADEFIQLAPNPFINKLNFNFVIKGYQKLNIEVFDIATGIRKSSIQNLTNGMQIYLGQLSAGTYYISVSSNDSKINYQFKMIKL